VVAYAGATYRCPIDSFGEVDSNCVEDVAFWECRDSFLQCISKVGKQVVTDSGQTVSQQSEWHPECLRLEGSQRFHVHPVPR
jgi:hypothetical protein